MSSGQHESALGCMIRASLVPRLNASNDGVNMRSVEHVILGCRSDGSYSLVIEG